jgi:hypothetical protein
VAPVEDHVNVGARLTPVAPLPGLGLDGADGGVGVDLGTIVESFVGPPGAEVKYVPGLSTI